MGAAPRELEPSEVLRPLLDEKYRSLRPVAVYRNFWVSISQLIAEYPGECFMAEHLMAFYVSTQKKEQFSGCIKLYGSADNYFDAFVEVRRKLSQYYDYCDMISPYRYKIPETPGFMGVVETLRMGRNDPLQFLLGTITERNYEQYGLELLSMQEKLLKSLDDEWTKYLIPDWRRPTRLYFLVNRNGREYLQVDCDAISSGVRVVYVDEIGLSQDSVEAVARPILEADPEIVHARTYTWGSGEIARSPLQDAFDQLEDCLNQVNSRLAAVNLWNCRPFVERDLEEIVTQELLANRWVLRNFGLGDEAWLRPLDVDVAYECLPTPAPGARCRVARLFRQSSQDTDRIQVKKCDLEEFRRQATSSARAWGILRSSEARTWMEGKRLTHLLDPGKVFPGIRQRDVNEQWGKQPRISDYMKALVLAMSKKVSSTIPGYDWSQLPLIAQEIGLAGILGISSCGFAEAQSAVLLGLEQGFLTESQGRIVLTTKGLQLAEELG